VTKLEEGEKMSKTLLASSRKFKVTITSEMEERIETLVLKTGDVKQAYESLGISKSGYYGYLQRHEDFRDRISRARARRKTLSDGNMDDLHIMAVEALKSLLGYGRTTHVRIDESRVLHENHEPTEWIEQKRTTWEKDRLPNLGAISKVLGEGTIQQIALRFITKGSLLDVNIALVAQILRVSEEEAIKQLGGLDENVFDDRLDLILHRVLIGEIAQSYNKGLIDHKSYAEQTSQISKNYQEIKQKVELRVEKLFGGKSYQEVLEHFQQMTKQFFFAVKEVSEDENIDRREIGAEATRRLIAGTDKMAQTFLKPVKYY
jgi:hypothetical protein